MTEELYDEAWGAIEPIMFEHMDFIRDNILTPEEIQKCSSEYIALRTVILKKFGITYKELMIESIAMFDSTYEENLYGK